MCPSRPIPSCVATPKLVDLRKSQVARNICKWVNIEGLAFLKYSKTVPFLRHKWSKPGEQMYTTNNQVHWNDSSMCHG